MTKWTPTTVAVASLSVAVAVAAFGMTNCKTFTCEELANCPRNDVGNGGSTASSSSTMGGSGPGSGGMGGAGGMGNSCMQPEDCASNFCVDGYCCDSACDGLCESCAVPGSQGICSAAQAGTNEDDECATGVCDGSLTCAVGTHLTSTRYGLAGGSERPNSLAVNQAGVLAIAGGYTNLSTFGGGTWSSDGPSDYDAFAASYDTQLSHKFSHGYQDEFNPTAQTGYASAVDPSGFVVSTGTFEGQTYFLSGGGTLVQTGTRHNMYIVRVNSLGNVQWANDYGSDPGYQTPEAIAVNNSGEIFVDGYFEDSINFNSPEGQLDAAGFVMDVFVAKLSANGNGLWARRYGDDADQRAHAIAVDAGGNVLLAGEYQGTINFGGNTLLEGDGRDGFLVKLDGSGNHVWSKSFVGDGDQEPRYLATDSDSNIIMAGLVESYIDLGGGPLAGPGYDVFVAKFDPDGNHLWSYRFGAGYLDELAGVAVDPVGNVILAGHFYNNFACGGETLFATGNEYDVYVCKLSKDGVHLWSQRFGDASRQTAAGVGADGLGNIYLSGELRGTVDFGGGPLSDSGANGDLFLLKLAP